MRMTSELMSGLTYYLHDESEGFRIQLRGDLSQRAVSDLDQARRTASSVFGGRRLVVDLTAVSSIDASGNELLDQWCGLGAQVVVTTAKAKTRVQSLTGVPITFLGADSRYGRWAQLFHRSREGVR